MCEEKVHIKEHLEFVCDMGKTCKEKVCKGKGFEEKRCRHKSVRLNSDEKVCEEK